MIWKVLIVLTNCAKPIIIKWSGDSLFTFGDLFLLTNYYTEPIRAGDLVVFEIKDRDIPIMHRVIRMHERNDGYTKFLTKGDDNMVDDRGLYSPEQLWLEKKDIIGKVKGYFPYLGMVIIVMRNFQLHLLALIIIGFFVLNIYRRWITIIY